MKRNGIFSLVLAAALCWGTANARERMVVTQAGTVYSIDAENVLKGADGDIDYTLDYDKSKSLYSITFTIAADDKDTPLMKLLTSGQAVELGTPQGTLITATVTGIEKMRGTAIATLKTQGYTYQELKNAVSFRGDVLALRAQGVDEVTFPSEGEYVLTHLHAMMDKMMDTTGQREVKQAPVAAAPVQKQEAKKEQATPAAPKITAQGTEFSAKNENALFKYSGTWVKPATEPNGRMLKVQESMLRTKQCKTAAMNMSSGGLYIYSSNGYGTTPRLPKPLIDALKELNMPHSSINDVVLTESNKWIIIYQKSGYKTSAGLPRTLLDRLSACNAAKQTFKSITLTDDGEWAVVTNKGYWCEGEEIKAFLDAAKAKYGGLQAVHRTCGGAMVAVCKGGVMCHKVPEAMLRELKTLEFEPRMIEFTDDGLYIITDGKEKVEYYL